MNVRGLALSLVLLASFACAATERKKDAVPRHLDLTNLRAFRTSMWIEKRDAVVKSKPDLAALAEEAKPESENAIEARILLLLIERPESYRKISAAWADFLAEHERRFHETPGMDPSLLRQDADLSAFQGPDGAVVLAERLLKDSGGMIANTAFRSGPDDKVPAFRAIGLATQALGRHPGDDTVELALLRAVISCDRNCKALEKSVEVHASARTVATLQAFLKKNKEIIPQSEKLQWLEELVTRIQKRLKNE